MRSRDSGNSDEFIREVDEAVRQERWLVVWKQYNAYIIGAAIAVIVGTAAGVGWQTYEANQRAANARAFAQAADFLSADRPAEAASAFGTLADRVGGGVAVIAKFQAAEAEKLAGDREGKLTLLESLAGSGDTQPIYQRLATLLAKQETLGESDTEALIDEIDRLSTPDNPWRASLIELKAIAQMKSGRVEEARETLDTLLAEQSIPANLQRRVSELLSALGGSLREDSQAVSHNNSTDAEAATLETGAETEAVE
jgi:hypothetical protein